MSFRVDQVNPEVLKDMARLFTKSTLAWTQEDFDRYDMNAMALDMAVEAAKFVNSKKEPS